MTLSQQQPTLAKPALHIKTVLISSIMQKPVTVDEPLALYDHSYSEKPCTIQATDSRKLFDKEKVLHAIQDLRTSFTPSKN